MGIKIYEPSTDVSVKQALVRSNGGMYPASLQLAPPPEGGGIGPIISPPALEEPVGPPVGTVAGPPAYAGGTVSALPPAMAGSAAGFPITYDPTVLPLPVPAVIPSTIQALGAGAIVLFALYYLTKG